MNLSIMEWNLHQQGGKGRVPPFVSEEIRSSDIVCLTEFCTEGQGRRAFIADLEQRGYTCAASDNAKGNDVLIAAKSCFPILNCRWEPCRGEDAQPENLRVDLDCGGRTLSVVGIRIKSLDGVKALRERNRLRKRQLLWALSWIKDIEHPVLLTGDFNNNRRGSDNPDWSMDVMEKLLKDQGFRLYTPEGSSMFEEHSDYAEFPYDHFAARGAKVSRLLYDRDFTGRDPLAYFLGRDFRQPWYPGADARELASVAPPFPDHAILKGTLEF